MYYIPFCFVFKFTLLLEILSKQELWRTQQVNATVGLNLVKRNCQMISIIANILGYLTAGEYHSICRSQIKTLSYQHIWCRRSSAGNQIKLLFLPWLINLFKIIHVHNPSVSYGLLSTLWLPYSQLHSQASGNNTNSTPPRKAQSSGPKVRKSVSSRVHEAVTAIALCHNVTPVYESRAGVTGETEYAEVDQDFSDENRTYQASSPDEVSRPFTESRFTVLFLRVQKQCWSLCFIGTQRHEHEFF